MFTGSTLGGPTINYITPVQVLFDNTSWNIKDVPSTGATYYGYTQTSPDPNKFNWKIRKDVTVGKVTTVQYAYTVPGTGNTTNTLSYGQFNFAWSGRTGLSYR